MKRIFYAFAAFLFVISACKKTDSSDVSTKLLIGTWNEVGFTTKTPTGKYVKFSEGGGFEATVFTGYDSYEIGNGRLTLKGSAGTLANAYAVSTDSLLIEPYTGCADPNGCATLYARQR